MTRRHIITAGEKPLMSETNVYTPESQLSSPGRLAGSMWRDLKASRSLAWRLMIRDISARYRQSALGILWAFLPPVVTAVTFVILNRSALINIGPTRVPYPVFVLVGAVLWQLFTDSLGAPLKMIENSKSMLAKINFPREALILSGMGQVLFDFAIRMSIVFVAFLIYRVPFTWASLAAPLIAMSLLLLGTMLGLLLAPLGALYTDVSTALPTVTALWFFLTPVVYPAPQHWPYSLLAQVNPVSPMLIASRDLATTGAIHNLPAFLIMCGITLWGLLVMWVLYRVSLPILIERMNA